MIQAAMAAERHEDFPIDTFRHLEGMLREIRNRVMARAAELAQSENPTAPIYRVTRNHIDLALREALDSPQETKGAVGLAE
jgi:hypothetical protein